VQAFEPRFFEVCPQCGKRAMMKDNAYYCQQHDVVDPNLSYLVNTVIDDGTGNIRCAFFRNQADILTGKKSEEMLVFRQNPEKFDEVKNALLGNIVKITGKVRKNPMFDRLEFNAQFVDPKPDPKKELESLNKE